MEVLYVKQENMADYGKDTNSLVYSAHVKVSNIGSYAQDAIEIISNTSWINKLDPMHKVTFWARAERTIDKLVKDILMKVEDKISNDFGEYMVSIVAQNTLVSELEHNHIPLAELLKEKVSGNPGFDFHTESAGELISFGEAKYSAKSNPHGKALKQIKEFIDLEKDNAEFFVLSSFVSSSAMENALEGKKAYVAAFSVNGQNPQKIINNALRSDFIDELLENPEIYIIGVEVND